MQTVRPRFTRAHPFTMSFPASGYLAIAAVVAVLVAAAILAIVLLFAPDAIAAPAPATRLATSSAPRRPAESPPGQRALHGARHVCARG